MDLVLIAPAMDGSSQRAGWKFKTPVRYQTEVGMAGVVMFVVPLLFSMRGSVKLQHPSFYNMVAAMVAEVSQ